MQKGESYRELLLDASNTKENKNKSQEEIQNIIIHLGMDSVEQSGEKKLIATTEMACVEVTSTIIVSLIIAI